MKRITLLFLVLLLSFGCAETKVHTEKYRSKDILVGEGNLQDIQKNSYQKWFEQNSREFQPNSKIIEQLKPQVNNYNYKIIMGTWCPDSRLQVPIFYKVLKESDYKNPDKIPVIYVPRKYKNYKLINSLNIKRVPTIIVYKNKKEIGRIIEYPMNNIETDLEEIFKGKYKHELSD